MIKSKYFILLFTILTLLNISTTFANKYKYTVTYTKTVTSICPPKSTRIPKKLKTSCPLKPTTTPKASKTPKYTTPKKLKTSCPLKPTTTPKTPKYTTPKKLKTSYLPKSTSTPPIKCGSNNKCPDNSCCSKDGLCGNDVSFCGVGCQPNFGRCFPFSTDATCGATTNTTCPSNDCCSQTGFCGSTSQHCVPNCQVGYGFCGTFNDGLDVISTCTIKNSIALTYDDGPRAVTNILLDKLKSNNIKATFFVNGNLGVNGSCIYDNAETLQRAFAEGHQIAAHTWSHPNLGLISKEEIIYQIDYLEVAFKKILGTVPKYFRPPFGTGVNVVALREELKKRGYKVILWDIDTRDWASASVKDSMDLFMKGISDGSTHISLSHDRIESTSKELAEFEISFSLKKSFKPMTVADCIGDSKDNWYHNPPKFGKRDDTWQCTKEDLHEVPKI
ncbi:hypothetical protein Glove_120g60 [Diversispora epigaea]|uniref:NodB homology domain-containing protein n=1 Tax=Diversispora epigaea TaxID=1348612 RepID=A0A397J273_9GLOM|nr:hypothetical protein Glove_120g60 [Diversispora epigaea]